MPMLQAILLSAGDFARGALHAKIFPEPIRMQLLDFYSHAPCTIYWQKLNKLSYTVTVTLFRIAPSEMTNEH